mmetsp:Transcript_1907/g.2553  ORF Transcript_1907/g.2553 Transcript_1907/m.2553 type:complete len:200 (-) Transcript_1907:4-603(-)
MESCRALATYCGEANGGEKASTILLDILAQFATNLEAAVKSYDRKLELEAKKAAQHQRRLSGSSYKSEMSTSEQSSKSDSKKTSGKKQKKKSKSEKASKKGSAKDSRAGDARPPRVVRAQSSKTRQEKGPSLVLMVNELLKDAPKDVKDEFVSGVIHEDADDPTLKAIYQREQETWKRNRPPGMSDLLSDIQARRKQND